MSLWHPSRAAPDFNTSPSGFTRTYTAGASITANNVVSLHTDGKVYPSSSSYPNVIGVALNSASSGGLVNVLIVGIATVVSDGSINSGSPVTFSIGTAGRVVAYSGHTHSVSLTTASAVTGVSTSTGNFVTGVSSSTASFITGVSSSTGSFVNSISVDRRDISTLTVLGDISITANNYVTSIGTDTNYSTDSSGYIRHTHGYGYQSAVTSITKNYVTVASGVTSTAGTTVTANVTAGTANAVTGISSTTGTAVTAVTPSTGSAVTGVSTSTGTFVQNVSVNANLNRVIGIALSSTTGAGQNLTILILPAWI